MKHECLSLGDDAKDACPGMKSSRKANADEYWGIQGQFYDPRERELQTDVKN